MKIIAVFLFIGSILIFIGGKWNNNLKHCDDCNNGSGAGIMLVLAVCFGILDGLINNKKNK